jgi:hypothetical protein
MHASIARDERQREQRRIEAEQYRKELGGAS